MRLRSFAASYTEPSDSAQALKVELRAAPRGRPQLWTPARGRIHL